MVVNWDKPKRVRSPQQHAEAYGFEDGPTGGYVPNMSQQDAESWKGTVTGQKRHTLQAELRKTFGNTQVTVIVCLRGGYTYKSYEPRSAAKPGSWTNNFTDDFNIHVSANGPIQMTFADLTQMNDAIAEARARLVELESAAAGD